MRIKDIYPPIKNEVNKLIQFQVNEDFNKHIHSLNELAEIYGITLKQVKQIIYN